MCTEKSPPRPLGRMAALTWGTVLLAVTLGMAVSRAAEDDIKLAHRAAITALLETSGVFSRAQAEADAMVARLSAANPRIPAQVWKRFAGRITNRQALERTYVPVYARHLSEEVALGLIAFYRTPVGARYLQAEPGIQEDFRREVQPATQQIAREILGADAHPPQAPAGSEVPADARTLAIHELLRVSGVLRTGRQVMLEMVDRMQQSAQADTLPPEFWESARQRLADEALLMRLWTPAYAHAFSEADIQALIGFYRGPVGARFVAQLPAIQQESTASAEQLAHDAARGAIRDVLGPLPQWSLSHPHEASGHAGGSESSSAAPPVWTREQP